MTFPESSTLKPPLQRIGLIIGAGAVAKAAQVLAQARGAKVEIGRAHV